MVQIICTIANYEYIFAYMFHTDGSIQLETKLSGILNLYVKDRDEPNPYGVEVAPQVNAHYHQHLFALKIDPMVDGCENTVIQTGCEPTKAPTGSDRNYLGNGFVTVKAPTHQRFRWLRLGLVSTPHLGHLQHQQATLRCRSTCWLQDSHT